MGIEVTGNNGNGNAVLEWVGMGTRNSFQHTSSTDSPCEKYGADASLANDPQNNQKSHASICQQRTTVVFTQPIEAQSMCRTKHSPTDEHAEDL